jgi:glycyl-tRNA synthetase
MSETPAPSQKPPKPKKVAPAQEPELMQKLVSLCKRRGIIFQSSEIYGGLKSAYDYGPLGVELKRNIKNEWWRTMVHEREDVVGIDASIVMHPKVWEASGHVAGFTDPLVDCKQCKARFRADKAPTGADGKIACPECGKQDLSDVRKFNLMFKTHLGPLEDDSATVFLRPETAQAMFVNFLNVQQSYRLKPPFGIAQQGKSFRNEITVEHFTFRSCEFEQMEMEYFIPPPQYAEEGKGPDFWYDYWRTQRLAWYVETLGIRKEKLRLREHEKSELAHYALACADVEYEYPWGWGELEGIASRGDFDLTQHTKHSGKKLTYFDQDKKAHYLPYVIEPAAGADRTALAVLIDAYDEEPPPPDAKGETPEPRVLLRLDPRLSPIKVAVLPLVRKDGMPERAREIIRTFWKHGVNAFYDEKDAVGRRYRRQDEVGTPFCITVDGETAKDDTVTIRYRDDMQQERIKITDALEGVTRKVRAGGRDVRKP